eukprot:67448-Rhodomonas_salina.2
MGGKVDGAHASAPPRCCRRFEKGVGQSACGARARVCVLACSVCCVRIIKFVPARSVPSHV